MSKINSGTSWLYKSTAKKRKNIVVSVNAGHGTKGGSLLDISGKKGDWADYLRGTAKILYDKYLIDEGIYCIIDGQLPIGGISSSAAVIIAFMKGFIWFRIKISAKDKS